jgi:hypothetical protein
MVELRVRMFELRFEVQFGHSGPGFEFNRAGPVGLPVTTRIYEWLLKLVPATSQEVVTIANQLAGYPP